MPIMLPAANAGLRILVSSFCSRALPMQGILGVIDGVRPLEFENDDDKKKRHEFLRMIGEATA
jgi:adenosine/AMP kinase